MNRTIARAAVLAASMLIALPLTALASEVDVTAVVDATSPTGSVTLSAGGSGAITIDLQVTGKQEGTATFKVDQTWTLSGGTFVGSNPATFTVGSRAAGDAANLFSTSGTVAVAAGQAGGTFTLSVQAEDVTNTNTTGAKLGVGSAASYAVTVQATSDPCLSVGVPALPVLSPDASSPATGWFTTTPTVTATSSAGATITYATEANGGVKSAYSPTAPTLGEGTTVVYAKATSATCNKVSESSGTYKVDTIAPTVTPASVVNSTWRNSSLAQAFAAEDLGSGLADSGDASFTLTAALESVNASTPTVVSKTVFDVAGNSTTRSVSAKIDLTDPTLTASLSPAAAGTGWYNAGTGYPTVTYTNCGDALSGLASACPAPFTFTAEGAGQPYSETVLDNAGNSKTASGTVDIDVTAPEISKVGVIGAIANDAGWYKTAVDFRFSATDTGGSGLATASPFDISTASAEGSAVKVNSGNVSDNAGNTTTGIDSDALKIDLTDPKNVEFDAFGSSFYFGFVDAKPGCSADDDVSGLASCVVTGYGTSVGSHTLTATATDNAGRTATATLAYDVLSWTGKGFYQPVDMNNVVNMIKGGQTVPLKFELFAGTTELTTASSVAYFSYKAISCDSIAGTAAFDDVEQLTSGQTVLRYDSTAGQFIQNWQTPKTTGKCYVATIGSADNVTTISAYFKTK